MIPMQITYTEYQRAEQPIADFITHLLLVIKKIASPFVLEYRQWGLVPNNTKVVGLPISYTKFKIGVGLHFGASPVIVIGLSDYLDSLNQIGFSTFSPGGSYNAYADVYWITLGY